MTTTVHAARPAPDPLELEALYRDLGWRLPRVGRPDLVALRHGGTGRYDDWVGLWWGDDRWHPSIGTTTPGRWIPGRAVIEPGLHEQALEVARHYGRRAWTNRGYALPYRRVDKDGRLGPLITGDWRGLNVHDNLGASTELVGDQSEGCVVVRMGHAEYVDRFIEPVPAKVQDVEYDAAARTLRGGLTLALIEVA